MASFSLLPLFALLIPFSSSLVLPITKHTPSGQYLTQLHPNPHPLLLHLSGSSLWTHCTTPTTLSCRSIQCSAATSAAPCPLSSTSAPPPCTLPITNPFTGASAPGQLVQDSLGPLDEFLMTCAPGIVVEGLPGGARGVVGFGRTRMGASTQIPYLLGEANKFSLCLPSGDHDSNGVVSFGHGFESDVSKDLVYTPLLNEEDGYGYAINLKGIRIQNKKLSLGLENKIGRVKISTIYPFSTMESGTYEVFVRAFTIAANLTSVPPVEPFESCFESSGSVPVIDLVLQSEMVKWRINGHNSMVKVKEDVMCLGFLNGGENMGASIVLGGHQLEDNLLEFDLGSSMLGFSSSLIMKQTSCSQLTTSSMHKDLHQSW